MGTDIYFFTDKRIDGSWKAADTFEREASESDPKGYLHSDKEFYMGRNYDLFAILANVRNGRGFAGVPTGEGFNPIAPPKGVPTDATPEYQEIVEGWADDAHSHSHFTLRELLDYNWQQVTTKQGCTSFIEWLNWDRHRGGPARYCGWVSGPNIKHITTEEMQGLLVAYKNLKDKNERDAFKALHADTYATAKWETTYSQATNDFWQSTIPKLLALAGGISGVDDVRVCFFFDN